MVTNKALDPALLLVLSDLKTLRLIVAQQVDTVGAGRVGDARVSSWTEALSSGQDGRPSVHCIDLDLESIVFTSGSTGVPKGVMLSHLNTVSNMTSICQYLQLSASDRIMAVLPFSYIYGKSLLLTHVLVGGSVVIDNRFTYPNVVLQSMLETEVTGFAGVPSTFTILLNRSSLGKMRFPGIALRDPGRRRHGPVCAAESGRGLRSGTALHHVRGHGSRSTAFLSGSRGVDA